jgi:hypothetical protein
MVLLRRQQLHVVNAVAVFEAKEIIEQRDQQVLMPWLTEDFLEDQVRLWVREHASHRGDL